MTAAAVAPSIWPVARRRFPSVSDCTMPAEPGSCTRTEYRYHLAHRSRWEHELKPTRDCSLSVANEGPHSMDEVAVAFGMSKERVRQLEERAKKRMRARFEALTGEPLARSA